MWGIGIVCLLLTLLVQLAIDVVPAEAVRDESRLQISVRKEALQRVTSCVHAFSQVELLNLDETEPIVIHSVDLAEEEIINIKSKEKDTNGVPQQIYVSHLSEITLGPKQEAIIPMTFVPRFPETSSGSSSADEPNVKSGERRNNLDYQANPEEYQVHTNLVLDTSRGVLKLPIEASSVRQNGFRLPDAIHFSSSEETSDACYDVHLSNPTWDYPLQIFDVIVSRPDLVKMYHQDKEVSDAELTAILKSWQDGEQRSIPPKVNDEYVVTLCPRRAGEPAPEASLKQRGGLSRNSDLNDGLGYLQIRTDKAILVVNLKLTEQGGVDVKGDAQENVNEFEVHDQVKECEVQEKAKQCEVQEKAKQCEVQEKVKECDVRPKNPKEASYNAANGAATPPNNLTLSITDAPELEIFLIPYVSPKFEKTVELRNMSPHPIRVMQTSLLTGFADDPRLVEAAGHLKLQIDAKIAKRNLAVISTDQSLMDETVILTCQVSSSSPLLEWNVKMRFSGWIVVHATADPNISYDEWKEKFKNNPQKENQLSMVFPFAVNVMDRKVHLALESSPSEVPAMWIHQTMLPEGVKALSGLSYPISRSEAFPLEYPSSSTTKLIDEEITYTLKILSPIGKPLEQAKIEVVNTLDGEGKPKDTDLCRRFLLSNFQTYTSPGHVGNSQLFHLGTATMKYNFGRVADPSEKTYRPDGKKGLTKDDGPTVPTTCYLQVLTDSADGGLLTVPIMLFPGKLDVTASEYEMSVQDKKLTEQVALAPSIISGFDGILHFLRSGNMGSAIKKVLKSIFGNRINDGPSMLAIYMAGLSTRSLSLARNSLQPILLNVGSVVHDEVQAFPLFLTNHNPVPIGVSIDVGEVEGMSISLARKYSHGKGDGNGLLDRLPKEENVKHEKVKSGRWEGHSKRGLYKFLLTSSDFPQAVSAKLQYRDDISPSPVATEAQPLLRSLYKEHDVGNFHAEPVPQVVHTPEASGCPSLELNPPGYSENERSLNDSFPLLMSDSLSIKRRLSVCSDTKNSTKSQDSHVSIPPGGVARFEVKVRCPSRSLLSSDITNFLSTGLVLSTDYGQVMPIFASFEALLGHLQLSTIPSSEASVIPASECYAESIIDVSPRLLFVTRDGVTPLSRNASEMQQSENASIPIFIKSSFTREVALNSVDSCNPWFGVELLAHKLKNETPTVMFGEKLEIGSVHSTIPCKSFTGSENYQLEFPDGFPRFPSFFDCTFDWLQNRGKLQPRGCGLPRRAIEATAGGESDDEVLKLATEVSRNILRYSLIRFNEGYPAGAKSKADLKSLLAKIGKGESAEVSRYKGTRMTSSYISVNIVDLYAQLNHAWRLVTEAGLNVLSSNLRAQIDYSLSKEDLKANSTKQEHTALDRKKSQSLSVAMREVAIRTSLEMPTLVDGERLSKTEDGSELPVLHFPPTRIADVTALSIPVRNPTSVPVRVRLASFAKTEQYNRDGVYDDVDFRFVSSDVREEYLNHYSQVYVQNEDIKDQPVSGDSQHWWEGGGAFVLPDDRGDLIQARYNLSITAASGAYISLFSPSLHAFNGLSLGCSTRCGVKEDTQKTIMKHHSSIGASSASGTSLIGQARPRTGPPNPENRIISAGGSTPGDPAHLAFAIPFSSQDEIVLPPYGVGELGPILFRPPGRHSTLGCGAVVESLGNSSSTRSECYTNAFESLVFLENSLTGLERVVVSGKGMLESVAILDPDPTDASPFGDLEYRYGRSTLVFPGSSFPEQSLPGESPVRKEVVIQNNGDVRVEYGHVYFSEAPDLGLNSPILPRSCKPKYRTNGKVRHSDEATPSSCQRRGFELVGCSESDNREIEVNGEKVINLWHGFELEPGQNVSLFVEHYPDCAFSSEYVALNLEYLEKNNSHTNWSPGPMRSRHKDTSQKEGHLKARKVEIIVGYEMSSVDMTSCVPLRSAAQWDKIDRLLQPLSILSLLNVTEWRYFPEKQHSIIKGLMVSLVRLTLICVSVAVVAIVMKQQEVRDTACIFFQTGLRGLDVNGSSPTEAPPSLAETDWTAAFRCLARADPLASELQAVGREQARQLVLDRYKSMGAITTQCISSAGVLQRDRSGAIGAGGTVSGGEKRAMTLSDVVFRGAFTDQGGDAEIDQLLPCSLGWRAASTKGMVRKLSRTSKSKELLAKRKTLMAESSESIPEETDFESEREYERSSAVATIPDTDDALEVDESDDEHKGDFVSTSESEGTDNAAKEVESPEEEDFAGFAKVGSQKGKGNVREKKKRSETKVVDRAKAKPRKEVLPDAPQVLVYKKEVNTNAKSPTVTSAPQHKKQASFGKSVSKDVLVPQKNKPAAPKKSPVTANAVKKVKKVNSSTTSAPPPPVYERTIGIVGSPVGMRSVSSIASSAHSSPSSVGQISVSSRSTGKSDTRRDQPSKGRNKDIRPPPGLAPPPGFGDGNNLVARSGSNDGLPPVVPNLMPEPSLSLGSNADFPPLSGADDKAAPTGTSIFSAEPPPLTASSPVLTSQTPLFTTETQNSGFDVMDFLDNILGDQETEEVGLGSLLAEETTTSDTAIGTAMPVSSNPWATERKSRASAYGIHVEDEGAGGEDDIVNAMLLSSSAHQTNGESSGGLQSSVPLLTPSILAATQVEDGEDSSSTPLFKRGSFYFSLLNEEE